MELPPGFTVENSGAVFLVLVFSDFVIKVPRKKSGKYEENLKRIAEIQNDLAGKVDGVLPCTAYGEYLVMPRAPGIQVSKIKSKDKETRARVEQLKEKMLKEIRECGYHPKDCAGSKNMFYDRQQDKLYMVDFHLVKRDSGR